MRHFQKLSYLWIVSVPLFMFSCSRTGTTPESKCSTVQITNRAPLYQQAYYPVSAGEIQPQRWLREELMLQLEKLDISRPVSVKGISETDLSQLGTGIQLAWMLNDSIVKQKLIERMDGLLSTRKSIMDPDILQVYYDVTRDERAVRLMDDYFISLSKESESHDPGIIKNALWLYNHIGEKYLLDFAKKTLIKHSNQITQSFLLNHDEELLLEEIRKLETIDPDSVIDVMNSLQTILPIHPEVHIADLFEKISFNTFPSVKGANKDGWLDYNRNLWYRTKNGGLAALLYGPCRLNTCMPDGSTVTIIEETDYPFSDTINFTFQATTGSEFELHLRIPGWCENGSVIINKEQEKKYDAEQIIHLSRKWEEGDIVRLVLPKKLIYTSCDPGSVELEMGPLVFAYGFNSRNEDSQTIRKYGLIKEEQGNNTTIISGSNLDENPWTPENSPLRIILRASRIQAALGKEELINNNGSSTHILEPGAMIENIVLLPQGCTGSMITEFPLLESSGR